MNENEQYMFIMGDSNGEPIQVIGTPAGGKVQIDGKGTFFLSMEEAKKHPINPVSGIFGYRTAFNNEIGTVYQCGYSYPYPSIT